MIRANEEIPTVEQQLIAELRSVLKTLPWSRIGQQIVNGIQIQTGCTPELVGQVLFAAADKTLVRWLVESRQRPEGT